MPSPNDLINDMRAAIAKSAQNWDDVYCVPDELAVHVTDHLERCRKAIAWAIDRLSIDDPVPAQIDETVRQLKIALAGNACFATSYVPPDWTEAAECYGERKDAQAK